MENWNISLKSGNQTGKSASRPIYRPNKPLEQTDAPSTDERIEATLTLLQDWFLDISKTYNIPEWMNVCVKEQRIASWGSSFPMSVEEHSIHMSVLSGLGIEHHGPMPRQRTYLKIGEWVMLDQIHISMIMMQPAIATASVTVTTLSVNSLYNALSKVEIISSSSTKRDSTTITNEALRRRVIGRKALSVVQEAKDDKEKHLPVTFAHLSYSNVAFVVTCGSEMHICTFSHITLALLRGLLGTYRNVLFHGESMNIYSWDRHAMNNTHMKISKDGDISILGTPDQFEPIVRAFKDLFHGILSNRSKASQLLSTLRVVNDITSYV